MIIRCPACSTFYAVDESALGGRGRAVKCTNCGHSWLQTLDDVLATPPLQSSRPELDSVAPQAPRSPVDPEFSSPAGSKEPDLPGESVSAPEAESPESTSPEAASAGSSADSGGDDAAAAEAPQRAPRASNGSVTEPDVIEESTVSAGEETEVEELDESPEHASESVAEDIQQGDDQTESDQDEGLPDDLPIPEVFTFPNVGEEQPPRRRFPVAAAAITGALVIVLIGALYLAREPLGMAFPSVAKVYDAIGLQPYRGYGLVIPKEAVKTEYQGGAEALEVSGIVLNESDRERPVPDLKISFLDAMGKEVQSVTAAVEPKVVPPRQQVDFVVLVENMAATATRLELDFADPN